MRLLRTIAVAFGLYSRIPMPHFEWKEEDMTYSISVFPWIGAVIGAIYTGVFLLCSHFSIPFDAIALILTAVPLIVTGGFHVDGFMDISDAFSSFRSREEKLEILKDPHIGAFAVIRAGILALIYIASTIVIVNSDRSLECVITISAGFMISRSLSALSVLTFPSARNEGMLFYEANTACQGRKANIVLNIIWLAAASAFILYKYYIISYFAVSGAVLSFAYYKYKSTRELGGITGDMAGWFVTICETVIALCVAVSTLI